MPADRLGMPDVSHEYAKALDEFDRRYNVARLVKALAVAKGFVDATTTDDRIFIFRGRREDVSKSMDVAGSTARRPVRIAIATLRWSGLLQWRSGWSGYALYRSMCRSLFKPRQ